MRSLDVVAHNLRERFGARYVSFLFVDIVDVVGRRWLRVNNEGTAPQKHGADQVHLAGSVYDDVLRTRQVARVLEGAQDQRVLATASTTTLCICPSPTPWTTTSKASLMATLFLNASRGARRAGTELAEQARQTHQALLDHDRPS